MQVTSYLHNTVNNLEGQLAVIVTKLPGMFSQNSESSCRAGLWASVVARHIILLLTFIVTLPQHRTEQMTLH